MALVVALLMTQHCRRLDGTVWWFGYVVLRVGRHTCLQTQLLCISVLLLCCFCCVAFVML
jgi:hypothetical protein